MPTLTLATRSTPLALKQTQIVAELLTSAHRGLTVELREITSAGDEDQLSPLPEIGGKGVFTEALDTAIRRGEVDAAVHSLKDLPVEDADGVTLAATPTRGSPFDAVLSPHGRLQDLPMGATVGTSSTRRAAQIRAARDDLVPAPIRGAIGTRIGKLHNGDYDAIILAVAGLERLGRANEITEELPSAVMLPAPGQGALAVQCRAGDVATLGLLSAVDDNDTRRAVTAERAFLSALGGGCSLPIGAFAEIKDGDVYLRGGVFAGDGERAHLVDGTGRNPLVLARELADTAIEDGALELLGG